MLLLSILPIVSHQDGSEGKKLLKQSAAIQNKELIKFIDRKQEDAREKIKECNDRLNEIWEETHRATSKEYIDTKVEKFNQQSIVDECEKLKRQIKKGEMSYDLAILQLQSLGDNPQASLTGNTLQERVDNDAALNKQYKESRSKEEVSVNYVPLLVDKERRDTKSSGVKLPDVIIKIQEIAPDNQERQKEVFSGKNPEARARYIKNLAHRLVSEKINMVDKDILKQAVDDLKTLLNQVKHYPIKSAVMRTQIKPDESIRALNEFAKKHKL